MKAYVLLTLSTLLFSQNIHARWMDKKDSIMKIEATTKIKVNKDLTNKTTYNLIYHITSERAKERLSIFNINYLPDYHKMKLQIAKIILKDGTEVPVNRDKIEYKDKSSAARGFSSVKEVRIPFKQIQVGGKVHIKYEIESIELRLDNEFSLNYRFLANGMHFLKEELELKSEVPLYMTSLDKKNWIRKKTKNNKYWKLSLRKDRSLYLIDEFDVANSIKHFPNFSFSNFKNWTQFKQNYSKQIQPRLETPLPKEIQKIARKIKRIKSPKEKVAQSLQYVIDNYTYLGDWRPVKGGHIPRTIKDITETKYGDCKDFSLLVTRILREAKVDAYPALIWRDQKPPTSLKTDIIPSLGAFNHMVVAVKHGNSTHYYDPTNRTVIYRYIPLDLADRNTLVIDTTKTGLSKTPAIDPKTNTLDVFIKVTDIDKKSELLKAKMAYQINGTESHRLLSNILGNPQPVSQLKLRDKVFQGNRVKSHKVISFPKKQKRLPKTGLKAKYNVTYTGPIIRSTTGVGIADTRSVGSFRLPSPEDIKSDRVNNLWIGYPSTSTISISFPLKEIVGSLPKECLVENEFFERRLNYVKTNSEVIRKDRLITKKSVIPHKILMTKKFIGELQQAKLCSEPLVILSKSL